MTIPPEAIISYDEAKVAYSSAYDAAYRVSGSRETAHSVALGTALQVAEARGAAAERDRIRGTESQASDSIARVLYERGVGDEHWCSELADEAAADVIADLLGKPS